MRLGRQITGRGIISFLLGSIDRAINIVDLMVDSSGSLLLVSELSVPIHKNFIRSWCCTPKFIPVFPPPWVPALYTNPSRRHSFSLPVPSTSTATGAHQLFRLARSSSTLLREIGIMMIEQKRLCAGTATRRPTTPHSINQEKHVATSKLLSYQLVHYLYVRHVALREDERPGLGFRV
jgi:hypothetical protein